ncbi:hypothetical protein HQQ94_02010 [Shewanella sp. VB17]|uniref:hypothetical protein n=1 Tax=Shewanella sp. VB17 TaxID=2739432 RepID=UPI001566F9CF|nr:hypothetical protein [Shewanella sp. VB17]NRD72035.1 hypothetical protein [Shewanella sp. VB17]
MNRFGSVMSCFCVTFIVAMWVFMLMPDDVIESAMSKIEFESEYEMFGGYHYNTLIRKGTLNGFSTCIKNYEPISDHRKAIGDPKQFNLIINEGVKLNLSVYGVNVHNFSAVETLHNNDKRNSKYYSVNCDLSLLGVN